MLDASQSQKFRARAGSPLKNPAAGYPGCWTAKLNLDPT
jgi:hypothetical protein